MAHLAFYRGPGDWRDKLVRAVTTLWHMERVRYSHLELLAAPPENGKAVCVSASKRDGQRVRIKVIRFKPGHWDFMEVPGHHDAFDRAAERAGMEYDTLGAILTVTPIDWQIGGAWFCSELIADALGLSDPHRYTPHSLGRTLKQKGITNDI